MTRMSDDDLFRELSEGLGSLGGQEFAPPPVRHAVPVKQLPPLERGTLVTVGHPGLWWTIDELRVGSGPHEGPHGLYYSLEPLPEPGAGSIRERASDAPPWAARVYGRHTRLDQIWVYRDDVHGQGPVDLLDPAETPLLDRINDVRSPPAVLRPWPAARAPMLIGRRIRIPLLDGAWAWAVCVTEPVHRDGDVGVGAVHLADYWRMVYDTAVPDRRAVIWVPLHTAWCYW